VGFFIPFPVSQETRESFFSLELKRGPLSLSLMKKKEGSTLLSVSPARRRSGARFPFSPPSCEGERGVVPFSSIVRRGWGRISPLFVVGGERFGKKDSLLAPPFRSGERGKGIGGEGFFFRGKGRPVRRRVGGSFLEKKSLAPVRGRGSSRFSILEGGRETLFLEKERGWKFL